MIIKDQKVEITWSRNNKKSYIEKGHIFNKLGEIFIVGISELSIYNKVRVKYICDYCNKEKESEYASLLRGKKILDKDACRSCRELKRTDVRIVVHGSLANNFSDLMKFWDYEKNNKSPFEYTSRTTEIVWWVCDKKHSYTQTIETRVRDNAGCPHCSGRRLSKERSLALVSPDIAKEWDSEKNGILTPWDVMDKSRKKVSWICARGHKYIASVCTRTGGYFSGCPYCSGKMVCIDNCLFTLFPEVSSEWLYSKNVNITPFDVTSGSGKKVWWKCALGHEWETAVSNRTREYGTNCPVCKESKGEKKVSLYLEIKNVESKKQFKFKDCKFIRPLPFDFAIFKDKELVLLVEYDGELHFKSVNYFNEKDGLLNVIINDGIKDAYCLENNIPLLRIPYWDFSNLENILESELSKHSLL